MRSNRNVALAFAFASFAPGVEAEASASEAPADLVLFDGAVYTLDAARSWASAVAVRSGRILYVGDDAGARALAGPATELVDLDGKMLLPAFVDSHVHPVSSGLELLQCHLHDLDTAEEVLSKVRDCVRDELPIVAPRACACSNESHFGSEGQHDGSTAEPLSSRASKRGRLTQTAPLGPQAASKRKLASPVGFWMPRAS